MIISPFVTLNILIGIIIRNNQTLLDQEIESKNFIFKHNILKDKNLRGGDMDVRKDSKSG
jgi:hypothetical protein